jgi:hypothetical protein
VGVDVSHQQWWCEVGQWEQEAEYEVRERERMNALEIQAEMDPDSEFKAKLEDKYSILRAWPGKEGK